MLCQDLQKEDKEKQENFASFTIKESKQKSAGFDGKCPAFGAL